jgi:hypothetical protein
MFGGCCANEIQGIIRVRMSVCLCKVVTSSGGGLRHPSNSLAIHHVSSFYLFGMFSIFDNNKGACLEMKTLGATFVFGKNKIGNFEKN